jgi:hypothetical protein
MSSSICCIWGAPSFWFWLWSIPAAPAISPMSVPVTCDILAKKSMFAMAPLKSPPRALREYSSVPWRSVSRSTPVAFDTAPAWPRMAPTFAPAGGVLPVVTALTSRAAVRSALISLRETLASSNPPMSDRPPAAMPIAPLTIPTALEAPELPARLNRSSTRVLSRISAAASLAARRPAISLERMRTRILKASILSTSLAIS